MKIADLITNYKELTKSAEVKKSSVASVVQLIKSANGPTVDDLADGAMIDYANRYNLPSATGPAPTPVPTSVPTPTATPTPTPVSTPVPVIKPGPDDLADGAMIDYANKYNLPSATGPAITPKPSPSPKPIIPGVKKGSEEVIKEAFVPNPDVAAQLQQQPQSQQGGQMPPQGAAPQQQAMPPAPTAMPQQAVAPQQMPPQATPPQIPPQGAAPQSLDTSGDGSLMDEVMAVVQQLPPEAQQQIAPIIQQLQMLPPDQREQQLQMLLEQTQQSGGMVAQAADEDMYAAMMQGEQQDPATAQAQTQGAPEGADAGAESAAQSAVEAKNELDNVRVTLSVRELLDLIGKGSATASLLKVQQLADAHNQKMEAIKQKSQMEAQKQQQEAEQQQAAQQQSLMGSGGIYSSPMDAQQPAQ